MKFLNGTAVSNDWLNYILIYHIVDYVLRQIFDIRENFGFVLPFYSRQQMRKYFLRTCVIRPFLQKSRKKDFLV